MIQVRLSLEDYHDISPSIVFLRKSRKKTEYFSRVFSYKPLNRKFRIGTITLMTLSLKKSEQKQRGNISRLQSESPELSTKTVIIRFS